MTFRVLVTWDGAGSVFLPESEALVSLGADAGATKLIRKAPGLREFEIPDGSKELSLLAQFSVSFRAVAGVPAVDHEPVWRAAATFDVAGTGLTPRDDPRFAGPHPLVVTTAASGVNGAALIQLRTTFVDVTKLYFRYATMADEYLREHDPSASLFVLGCTDRKPLLWFASMPRALARPPSPSISCMVFFRPQSYAYQQLDQAGHTMLGINRYLLKPVPGSTEPWKLDRFSIWERPNKPPQYLFVRCGFEDAVKRSGKQLLMLHPLPNLLDYGDAAGAKLTALAEAAIRFLWANQVMGQQMGGVHLGRFGLAGFSAGGGALWTALEQNRGRVDEVFAFDATGIEFFSGKISDWFTAAPDRRCLRMSSGLQIVTNATLEETIDKKLTPAQQNAGRVTAIPGTASAYEGGLNPRWDHAISKIASDMEDPRQGDLRNAARHQFAIFGGFITGSGPDAMTFLQRFLTPSDF